MRHMINIRVMRNDEKRGNEVCPIKRKAPGEISKDSRTRKESLHRISDSTYLGGVLNTSDMVQARVGGELTYGKALLLFALQHPCKYLPSSNKIMKLPYIFDNPCLM